MKRDFVLYLDDMLDSIDKIEEYTKGLTEEAFHSSSLIQDAVGRRLEIIGEAARNVPQEVRDKHPGIPWQDIAGMRNRLTHEYFGVQLHRVWRVVQDDLADLKHKIREVREMADRID